jgi:DUF3048 family protein
MALTRRGKMAAGALAGVLVLGGVAGVLAFTGNAPAPLQRFVDTVVGRPSPCPLTGLRLDGDRQVPDRPVIGVKIGNTEEAYPLAGLNQADVIYEEPVEGGLTRFVALFQCRDARRVGPVRSARTTDPRILSQYGEPSILAYSGSSAPVDRYLDKVDVVKLTETSAADAYARDDSRSAPHNLYASTRPLYRAAKQAGVDRTSPEAIFAFDDEPAERGKRARSASVTFSFATTAEWTWSGGRWVRLFEGSPMTLEDGEPLAVDNVLIQQVRVRPGIGSSPDVTLTGSGRAWLLRGGRVVAGRWTRPSLDDVATFETRGGDVLTLAPGTTFVELVPKDDGEVTFER